MGERIVTPGSIVSLKFQARYIYPTTSTSISPVKAIPNGVADEKPSSDAADSVADVEETVAKTEPETTVGDIKEKIVEAVEVAEDKVSEKKDVKVGRKGKAPGKDDKSWASNGFAFAPRWPQVSSSDGCRRMRADAVAA